MHRHVALGVAHPEAHAVVRDADAESPLSLFEDDVDRVRAGVLHHVRDRLLGDPVQDRPGLDGGLGRQRALEPVREADVLSHPFEIDGERCCEALTLQRGWDQFEHQVPEPLHRVPNCDLDLYHDVAQPVVVENGAERL